MGEKSLVHRLPEGIFFDLDGTLVDSLCDLINAANRVLAKYAPQKNLVQKDFFRAAIGDASKIFISKIFAIKDPQEISYYEKIYHEDYALNCAVDTAPYPGIIELLQGLNLKKIPLVVISNKPVELVQKILSTLKLADYFAAILGGDSAEFPKPHPALLKLAEKSLDAFTNANNILHIGDGTQDIQAAKNFGCKSCWVSWGYNQDHSLGPDFIAHEPGEILQKILPEVRKFQR